MIGDLVTTSNPNLSTASYSDSYEDLQSFSYVCAGTDQGVLGKFDGVVLESVGLYQSVDLVCEGLTEGLCDKYGNTVYFHQKTSNNEDVFQGIYLNDVPVKNTDSLTINFPRVFAEVQLGSEIQKPLVNFDNAPYLSFTNSVQAINTQAKLVGLTKNEFENSTKSLKVTLTNTELATSSTENVEAKKHLTTNVNNFLYDIRGEEISKIRSAESAQVAPFTHTITNKSVTALNIEMSTNGLSYKGSYPNAVNFVIKTGYVGDNFLISQGGSIRYLYCGIAGICSGPYFRSYFINLPPPLIEKDRFVKIFRTDAELDADNVFQRKDLMVSSIGEIVEVPLSYPSSMIVGMVFDARTFSSPPKRSFDCKMLKINVPINYNPDAKTYDGNWTGEFSTVKKWTNNPAWILYDLMTNTRYGVGKFGMKHFFIDKWNLYKIGKYCDELVPTGYSGKFPLSDFTITSLDTEVVIDDSSTNLGEEALRDRFPDGTIASLFDTVDSGGTLVDKAYRRLIIGGKYENNSYKFKLVALFSIEQIFSKYPELRTSFNAQINFQNQDVSTDKGVNQDQSQINHNFNSPAYYLLSILINPAPKEGAKKLFYDEYVTSGGQPLDAEVVGGKVGVDFQGQLPLLEPRFACNVYLDREQNALNAINDLSAIFRGMVYWSSGNIFIANDEKRDAVMLFTNSNVVDGVFVYSGSADSARHTVVTVRYNDETDSYKPKVEYVENSAGLREYGYKQKDIVAIGVTSRGQAHRLAKWMLSTNQTETDTVQFSTGQEGSYLRPGDVIKIQDKLKSVKRYGGRIVAVDYAARKVTLDQGIQEDIVGQKITFITPRENKTAKKLNEEARLKINVQDETGLTDEEINSRREPQIKEFTVSAVSETNVVTVSETSDQDFNLIKSGYLWSAQNLSADYEIKEVEYRVLTITEKSSNEYMVTGLMYNRTKFDNIDRSKSIENTQQSVSQIVNVPSLPEPLVETNNSIEVSFRAFDPETDVPPYFDGKFPLRNQRPLQKSYRQQYVNINFQALAADNNVNASNTGGYILQVAKSNGDVLRVTLDGWDNQNANIFLGELISGSSAPTEGTNTIDVKIFRYDPDKRLEGTIGLTN